GPSHERQIELDREISAHESQVEENLATVRTLEQQWDDYRQVMRDNTARFEEASAAMDAKNYFEQKALTARKELDSYVGQIAREQEELLAETAREIRSVSEAELERLRHEK